MLCNQHIHIFALYGILSLLLNHIFISSLRVSHKNGLFINSRLAHDYSLLISKTEVNRFYSYNVEVDVDTSANLRIKTYRGQIFDVRDKNDVIIQSSGNNNGNNKNRKQFIKLTFSNPTGLLITEIKRNHTPQRSDENISHTNGTNTSNTTSNTRQENHQQQQSDFVCMLQHDVLCLRPQHSRVFEMPSALSKETCAEIIQKAEKYARKNDGWTRTRHIAYPTTDLPLDAVFGKFSYIRGLTNGMILPELARVFGLTEYNLFIGEMFIAKYEYQADGSKQNSLKAHLDGPPWSFVVTLNDPSTEFQGGGTHFLHNQETYRPAEVGTAVLFSGKNLHSGVAVTQGVRYILTGFCDYYDLLNKSHELFMSEYDDVYDGTAAGGGVHTGDVLRGMWTGTGSGRNTQNHTKSSSDTTDDTNNNINSNNNNSNNNIRFHQIMSKTIQQQQQQQTISGSNSIKSKTNKAKDDEGIFIDFTGMSSEQIQQTIYDCTNNQDGYSSQSDGINRKGNSLDKVTILVERQSNPSSMNEMESGNNYDDDDDDDDDDDNSNNSYSNSSNRSNRNYEFTLSDIFNGISTTNQQQQPPSLPQQEQQEIDDMIEEVKRDAYYRLAIGNYWKFDDYMTFQITGAGAAD